MLPYQFLKKIEQLINFWAPLQRVSNKKKKLQNKHWITKGLLKSIEKKIDLKDYIDLELVNKVKIYKKNILNLTRKGKTTHFNNFFWENELHLFKTWEGIRKIINKTTKMS